MSKKPVEPYFTVVIEALPSKKVGKWNLCWGVVEGLVQNPKETDVIDAMAVALIGRIRMYEQENHCSGKVMAEIMKELQDLYVYTTSDIKPISQILTDEEGIG